MNNNITEYIGIKMKCGTIRHIVYFLLFIPFFLISQSCVEERPKILDNKILSLEPLKLEISSNKADFTTPESGSQTITVRSSYLNWAFSGIPDWITVSPSYGSGNAEVGIYVSENTRAVNRVGVLTFGSMGSNWNYSMGFTVSQYRAPYNISLPVDSIQIDGGGGTKTLLVETNTDTWTIMIPESMGWCTASKTEGGIVVTATSNTGNTPRSGKIELHTDDVSAFLSVYQRPAGVNLSTDRVDFPVAGGVKSISINIEVPWTVETTYSWIDIKTKSGGAGFVSISMEATPNFSSSSRDGLIYIILSDSRKIEVPIHQDCLEFSLDKSTISFPSGGSTELFGMQTNVSWFIPDSVLPSWLNVDPLKGSGNAQILVKTSANKSFDKRKALFPIYIVPDDASNTILDRKEVEIVQSGRLFGADSTAIYFSDKAGSTSFNIRSDGYWFVNSPDTWISLSPDEGDGNDKISVSVTENNDSLDRVGSIILRTHGQRDTIPVYQLGRYIHISSELFIFGSRRDSTELSIVVNGHWIASASDTWIELSAAEGDSDCRIMITTLDNPSSSSREGEVTITCDDMSPVKILVQQKGRYLKVSTSSIEFFCEGGTSEPVIVQTDGKYEIKTESDWLTISRETESQFTITASENPYIMPRTGTVTVYLADLTNDIINHTITLSQKGQSNGYEYVDLGLSVNWATFNVGATKPEEYGDYYAWGEIETKTNYTWTDYKFRVGGDTWDNVIFSKYNTSSSYGTVDNKTILDLEDDVAHVKWGGGWRMPTCEEQNELINNCTWTWYDNGNLEFNGVSGYKVTSNVPGYTDHFIFLPADTDGFFGCYWSSSLRTGYPNSALLLDFNSGYVGARNGYDRFDGLPVRPVFQSEEWISSLSSISFVEDNKTLVLGGNATLNVFLKQNDEILNNPPIIWSSDNPSVAVVDKSGVLTAISTGTAHITASIQSLSAKCTVVVIDESEIEHEYVDLGLSVRWATINVGAFSPEDLGAYYAWGEIEPKTYYYYSTYNWCNGDYNTLIKYCNNSESGNDGFTDTKTVLDSDNDVAQVKWGGNWRMPTGTELEELLINCTWSWYSSGNTEFNGVAGYKVTSNIEGYTDRSIFLPAAGNRDRTYLYSVGSVGDYWSSSLDMGNPNNACRLSFYSDFYSGNVVETNYAQRRYLGLSVRPVFPSEEWLSSFSISFVEEKKTLVVGGNAMLNVVVKQCDEILNNPSVVWSSDNPLVAVVDKNGVLTAKSTGIAHITASIHSQSAQCTLTVIDESGIDHEYVDLGLSVNWATVNVGAKSPEEFGAYYAWGELETKDTYDWSNYKWCNGDTWDNVKINKYNNNSSYGTVDNKTTLDPEDDIAHVKWQGNWRMPTGEELDELRNSCTWVWFSSGNLEFNGVAGYKVTSNKDGFTDRFIFLPAAGTRSGTYLNGPGINGMLWSSSLCIVQPRTADKCLIFIFYSDPGEVSWGNYPRSNGYSVRPVCP